MGLFDNFDPTLAAHDLVQDLKWDPELRQQFEKDIAAGARAQ